MTIEQAREALAATHRIYSSREWRAMVEALLAEIEQMKNAEQCAIEQLAQSNHAT